MCCVAILPSHLVTRPSQSVILECTGYYSHYDGIIWRSRQVRRALPLIPTLATKAVELKDDGGGIVDAARALLGNIRAYQSRNFPTSAEQDEELLG